MCCDLLDLLVWSAVTLRVTVQYIKLKPGPSGLWSDLVVNGCMLWMDGWKTRLVRQRDECVDREKVFRILAIFRFSGMTYKWLRHTPTHKQPLSQVIPQILQWFTVNPFLSCHLSLYSFYFLWPPSRRPRQFSDSYREKWRSEFVCLIVCHENGISVDGWRDSGGEMQSYGKRLRKGWIVIVTDFLSPA